MPSQIEVRQKVANRLKVARESAGYTSAQDFCKTHNLPLEQYIRHENGDSIIRASQAMQYAKLLNTTLQWLMLGDNWKNQKI
jgi:hypothetical protein